MSSLKTDKFMDKTNDEHNWLSHINKRKYVVYFFKILKTVLYLIKLIREQ